MSIKHSALVGAVAIALAGCGGGDIEISTSTTDNSQDNSVTEVSGGDTSTNPCASYTAADGSTQRGSFDGANCTYGRAFVDITNPILTDVTIPLISGVHIFQGSLAVGIDASSAAELADAGIARGGDGATLTIEAGSTLAFSASENYVLINRGSQIQAVGTPAAPITFTAFVDAVRGQAGAEDVSLWGGLVINGFGRTNNCTDAQRAANECHVIAEGQPSNYGGDNNGDNSGTLSYVVVKHTGFEVAPGDELNGVAFNAVGSGTTVNNLQAYSTFDDGIEFFGGAVNVNNYVALYVRDDSIDFSDGYKGEVTNSLVIHAENDGNRCVEGDGIGESRVDAGEDQNQAPTTNVLLANLTCLPSSHDAGTHDPSEGIILRRGARAQIVDSLIVQLTEMGSNECLEIDDESSRVAAEAGESSINGTLIACTEATKDDLPSGSIEQWVLGAAPFGANTGNAIISTNPNQATILETGTYFSLPVSDMTDANGNAIAGLSPSGDLIGAVSASDDWTVGWTFGLKASNRSQPLWFE